MSIISNKRKRKGKQQGKISTYHTQEPFCMKEDFTPPETLQLHHIFGEQKGLLQRRGNMTTYTPIKVPLMHHPSEAHHQAWELEAMLGALGADCLPFLHLG